MANIKKIKLPNGTTYDIQDSGALPLTGGTVTGPVIFQDTTSMDEATIGDLVVNGNASFTNNIQVNTINGGAVGNNPKFTDTVTTATTTGSGNAVTAITASNGAITVTKGTTFLTSHQDISGKADKTATVSNVAYDSTNAKITKTINGTTSDVVTVATLKSAIGAAEVAIFDYYENYSSRPKPTYSEIEEAYYAGKQVYLNVIVGQESGNEPLPLMFLNTEDSYAFFNYISASDSRFTIDEYAVTDSGITKSTFVCSYYGADSGGTNLSLVTTGEKYIWNNKSNLALGETSSTAYRGDRGKTAYDHSQSTHARTDATAVTSSTTNGNIKINGTETTVYTHPGSGTNPHGTTKSDVGLGNVGNFKAVSTVASQGLTSTEQSNARANIGAGTSSLTIGTTASTAAAGNHTHTASLATSTGTSSITLEHGAKYALTAGGSSVIFTMPTAASNSDTKVTQAYSTANNSYPVLFSATAGVSSTSSRGETTSILNNAIYANPSTGNLQVTKLNSYTPGAAMAKAVDTSISAGSTSTNLPTSGAVASFVEGKGYITSYTDTKNTAGATDTSSRIYLIGATSQGANPQTYSQDTAYVGTDGCLYSNNSKVALASHTHTLGEEVYTPSTGEAMFKISPGNSYKFSVDSASFKFSVESANATTDTVGSASLGTAIPADDITAWSAGTVPSLTVTSTSVVTSATVSGTTLTLGTGTVGSASGWSAGTAPSLSYTAKSIPNVSVTNKTVVTGIS